MLLATRQVEKPWGRDVLPPPFEGKDGARVGEIWFEPPAQIGGLLVKYIFTSEKLSVQVHPNDDQTQAAGLGRQGKEECWLVVDAQPGAKLGVGFREALGPDAMRAAAVDGSIEAMLDWYEVKAGDFFYIPANTVHAIGPGVSIIEVQQNSDITYRLFDYGRPRELHLDEAVNVADGRPHDPQYRSHVPLAGNAALVDGPYFRLDRIEGAPLPSIAARHSGPLLVIPLDQAARVNGEGVLPGQCAMAEKLDDAEFAADGLCLLASTMA